ncbi:hypothetical protein KA001_02090 [Patescibacteria group bacterium]|nr:hypothetical protein [Patescibacteria group bacterium]
MASISASEQYLVFQAQLGGATEPTLEEKLGMKGLIDEVIFEMEQSDKAQAPRISSVGFRQHTGASLSNLPQ